MVFFLHLLASSYSPGMIQLGPDYILHTTSKEIMVNRETKYYSTT